MYMYVHYFPYGGGLVVIITDTGMPLFATKS